MSTDPAPPTPVPLPWYRRINPHWIGWALAVFGPILAAWLTSIVTHQPMPAPGPIPAPPDEPLVIQGSHGWVKPDAHETAAALADMEREQGMPAQFSRIAQAAMDSADNNASAFAWDAEKKVLGRVLPSWDQGPYGECVSFGWARGAQDILLAQIAFGAAEQWPGHEVATEPIYGGSRVQIGGGKIRGDGSVGAWAGQFVQKYGLCFRQSYGNVDLSHYSGALGRKWGVSPGVPSQVLTAAREHPVKTVAQVTRGDEIWGALGNHYPVMFCSDVGFEGKPPASGIMEPRGTWGHCMVGRGRFTHPTKGRCVVIQNSWGGYIPRITVDTTDRGRVELPEGCFAIRLAVAVKMAAQDDTFTASGAVGFPARKLDWIDITRVAPPRRAWLDAPFALAP